MQRVEAGIPTLAPSMSFDAMRYIVQWRGGRLWYSYSQISHHTGATLFTFPVQTSEFTKPIRQEIAVQIMNAQVPEFQA